MDWFEITPFANGVFRLTERGLGPLHAANLWLVVGEDAALLIDAGTGVAPLLPAVRKITSLPLICLLTHSHYDHIGSAYEFDDRRIHRAEAEILAAPTAEATFWGGWLTAASFLALPTPNFDFSTYAIRPAPATNLVEDGDIIDLGGRRLEILHVPGHAPGLLAAFEPATATLFSSDALYDGRMFFNLRGSNQNDAITSFERLARIGAEVIHPGHYQSLTGAQGLEIAMRMSATLKARTGGPQDHQTT